MKNIKITKNDNVCIEIVEMGSIADMEQATDHFLAYMYVSVSAGVSSRLLERLFPFEDELREAVSIRLAKVMRNAAGKLGYSP